MYLHAAGDVAVHYLIQAREIQFLLTQVHREHTAADIHAHNVGNHLITQVGGEPDDTALAGVHIGHDAHLRPRKRRLRQKLCNLLLRQLIHLIGVNFQIFHNSFLSFTNGYLFSVSRQNNLCFSKLTAGAATNLSAGVVLITNTTAHLAVAGRV